jgi:glycosyltransferase involved in cell wall biosynthesis
MAVEISIIIPCHNDGIFLTEAINSVLACAYRNLELIIIDDGSTDKFTLDVLAQYKALGFKVISHSNHGLAYSRNQGIKESQGKYILPLDADNKIRKDYLDKAINFLDAGICDIAYAKPYFFGEDIKERRFVTHEFDGDKLFVTNYIDACAVYRKTVWEVVGGYDENMPSQGNEDWEFWLSCYIKGFRFQFLDEELYEYRITGNSMLSKVSMEKTIAVRNYLMSKHIDFYREQFLALNTFKLFFLNDQKDYLRTTAKYFYKWIKNL